MPVNVQSLFIEHFEAMSIAIIVLWAYAYKRRYKKATHNARTQRFFEPGFSRARKIVVWHQNTEDEREKFAEFLLKCMACAAEIAQITKTAAMHNVNNVKFISF